MTKTHADTSPQPYMGTLHEGTSEGFRKLLDAARAAAREGFVLVAAVPLRDGKIGTIYRNSLWKRSTGQEIPPDDHEADFFDEHTHAASMQADEEDL